MQVPLLRPQGWRLELRHGWCRVILLQLCWLAASQDGMHEALVLTGRGARCALTGYEMGPVPEWGNSPRYGCSAGMAAQRVE